MDLWDFLLVGIGLSMDAVCISLSNGICSENLRFRHAVISGILFGLFQGIMPAIGYFAGALFVGIFSHFSFLLVFIIFTLLGGKMIWDSTDTQQSTPQKISFGLLLIQAVATSIDALAVGISFSVMRVSILSAISIIATTTFFLTVPACLLGKQIGTVFEKKAGILGGLILILIGFKILLENTLLK